MPILRRNARHFSGLKAFPNLNQLERVLNRERIVAVGLLTQRELTVLGPTFDRVWPVEQAPEFRELLRAIDEADAKLRYDRTQ